MFTDPNDARHIVLAEDPARLADGRVVATLDAAARANAGGAVITVNAGNCLSSDTVTVRPVSANESDDTETAASAGCRSRAGRTGSPSTTSCPTADSGRRRVQDHPDKKVVRDRYSDLLMG